MMDKAGTTNWMAANRRIIKKLLLLVLVFSLLCVSVTAMAGTVSTTNEADGSKIEWIHLFWLTKDTVDDGNDAHLYLAPQNDNPLAMQFRVEFALSGEYDYEPGTVQLTIPAQIWQSRAQIQAGSSDKYGNMTLSVPKDPDTSADFNYRLVDGNYIITNARTISAASTARFDFTVLDITPHLIKDMEPSKLFDAKVEVVTHLGNVISTESEKLQAVIDTYEEITRTVKSGEVITNVDEVPEEILNALPAGRTFADRYVYVRWYTYLYHRGNQPFSLELEDGFIDAYKEVKDDQGNVTRQYVTPAIFLGETNSNAGTPVTDTDGKVTGFTEEVLKDTYHANTNAAYDHVRYFWTAYAKADMPAGRGDQDLIQYNFYNGADWTLTEMDSKVTSESHCESTVQYTPSEFLHPPGDFVVLKYSGDSFHTHEEVRFEASKALDENGNPYPIGVYLSPANHQEVEIYGGGLDLLLLDRPVEMGFEVVSVIAGLPFTTGDPNKTEEELEEGDYHIHGWKMVTYDAETFFNSDKENPLTVEDYEIASVQIYDPVMFYYDGYRYLGNNHNNYIQSAKLPKPDLTIDYYLNGEWHTAGTIIYGTDGKGVATFSPAELDASAFKLNSHNYPVITFPANTTNYRATYISNRVNGQDISTPLAGVVWSTFPRISLKPSEKIKQIVYEAFEESETPSINFQNTCNQQLFRWNKNTNSYQIVEFTNYYGERTDTDFDESQTVLTGSSYGVTPSKTATFDRKKDNDTANQRATIHYTAAVKEQSNLTNRSDYDTIVEAGVIPAETSGVWYDLLPEGMTPVMSSIKLRSGDTITNSYTIPNYQGTTRTLLVVEAKLKPAPTFDSSAKVWGDTITISFDAYYPWEALQDNGSRPLNYVRLNPPPTACGRTAAACPRWAPPPAAPASRIILWRGTT